MSYKSKHTGAQVDEAVSKVLNGEVGGGADWNAQKGEPGYIENKPFDDEFIKTTWNIEEYGSYTYADSQTNVVKIDGNIIELSDDITHIESFGPLLYNNVLKRIQVYSNFDLEDISNRVLVSSVKQLDEKYISDTIARKDDIVTPDWNAQAGEAGYIDNKPFGEGFKAVNWFYDDGASFCITPMISNKVKYEGIIYEIPDNTDDGPVSLGDGSFALGKYPYYDDNLMHVTCYGIQDESDERLKKILFKTDVKINSDNIDDTVIKTTPQSLSDADKNQALANLGIDNTKYILSVAPDNKFNIREFIDKFGFIAALEDDGYGNYVGCLEVTNKELFLDNVLCCGFNTSLAKCIYVKDGAEVVFFFEEGLAKGNVKVTFAENDINSTPIMICWEPIMN